jgi:hypothetical protein
MAAVAVALDSGGTSDTLIGCGAGPADKADLDLLPKDPKVKGCERRTRH